MNSIYNSHPPNTVLFSFILYPVFLENALGDITKFFLNCTLNVDIDSNPHKK